jgi:hypothetical protein
VEFCLRAIPLVLLVAGCINACDNGAVERARERERAQDREEERVRKEERDAIASARIKGLQEQIEDEKGESHARRPHPASIEEEDSAKRRQLDAMLSAMAASATAKPRAPSKCTCKPDDPLCDCL